MNANFRLNLSKTGIFWTMVRPFLDPVTAAKVKCIYSNNPKSMEVRLAIPVIGIEDHV